MKPLTNPRSSVRRSALMHGAHELLELGGIEAALGAEPAAGVDGEGLYLRYRLADVEMIQSTRQINRHADGVANASADRPLVRAAGATELLGGERRIPGI